MRHCRMADSSQTRHRALYSSRTAETQAGFLLPYLRPGMAVLDVGCGPGTITVGLAAAVAPGPVTGLDKPEALPEDLPGVTLVPGDARELPFPDASFDAVYLSTLLQHLPDPLVAVREAVRVLRPGGVVAAVDADWDAELRYPDNEVLRAAHALATRRRLARGTSPYVGRELRALLAHAGLTGCVGYARVGCDADPESVGRVAELSAAGYADPRIVAAVVADGQATEAEMAAYAQAWREWGRDPGAYLARLWCEAIGWKPSTH